MRIVIRTVERDRNRSPAEFVKWLCKAFGLVESISEGKELDQQILEKLIIASKLGTGITSSEMGKKEGISRSTVIYHLNRLIETGLVSKRGRKYFLRAFDMASTIKEMEYDIDREFSRLHDAAQDFDRMLVEQMGKMQNGKTVKKGGYKDVRR